MEIYSREQNNSVFFSPQQLAENWKKVFIGVINMADHGPCTTTKWALQLNKETGLSFMDTALGLVRCPSNPTSEVNLLSSILILGEKLSA